MDKVQAGRLLASLRPEREIRCSVCGKTFMGIGRRQYCSKACKMHAYYAKRHPGAQRRKPAQPAPVAEG